MTITAATAQKLCNAMGITEDDAESLLSLQAPSPDELAEAAKVSLPAMAAAFSETLTETLVTDKKFELPRSATEITEAATRVRTLAHLESALGDQYDAVHAAGRQDCTLLAEVAAAVMPQLLARIKTNRAVKNSYASLLAYWHQRFPGHRAAHATPAPSPAPAPAK